MTAQQLPQLPWSIMGVSGKFTPSGGGKIRDFVGRSFSTSSFAPSTSYSSISTSLSFSSVGLLIVLFIASIEAFLMNWTLCLGRAFAPFVITDILFPSLFADSKIFFPLSVMIVFSPVSAYSLMLLKRGLLLSSVSTFLIWGASFFWSSMLFSLSFTF